MRNGFYVPEVGTGAVHEKKTCFFKRILELIGIRDGGQRRAECPPNSWRTKNSFKIYYEIRADFRVNDIA